MFKALKNLTVTFIATLALMVPMMSPALVHADAITDQVCTGVNTATSSAAGTSCGDTKDLNGLVTTIIDIFSWIVGAVSVIMIIYGGFKYITSGGNDKGVGSAKSTIMYAIIGLVIVALAQVIVRFVLTKTPTA